MGSPEMSDRVYTGLCYSPMLGKDFICAVIIRTYNSDRPYEVRMMDYLGELKSSALSESWDDALIKVLRWRISSAPKDYKSHPDQDLITSEKKDIPAIDMRKRLNEFNRSIDNMRLEYEDEDLVINRIVGMNEAKSILMGIEMGSPEWIDTLHYRIKGETNDTKP